LLAHEAVHVNQQIGSNPIHDLKEQEEEALQVEQSVRNQLINTKNQFQTNSFKEKSMETLSNKSKIIIYKNSTIIPDESKNSTKVILTDQLGENNPVQSNNILFPVQSNNILFPVQSNNILFPVQKTYMPDTKNHSDFIFRTIMSTPSSTNVSKIKQTPQFAQSDRGNAFTTQSQNTIVNSVPSTNEINPVEQVDVKALSETVYDLITKRIRLEKERNGYR